MSNGMPAVRERNHERAADHVRLFTAENGLTGMNPVLQNARGFDKMDVDPPAFCLMKTMPFLVLRKTSLGSVPECSIDNGFSRNTQRERVIQRFV